MRDVRLRAVGHGFLRRIGHDRRSGPWPAHAEPDPVRGAVLLGHVVADLPGRHSVGRSQPDDKRKPDGNPDVNRHGIAVRLGFSVPHPDGKHPDLDGVRLGELVTVGLGHRQLQPLGDPIRHDVERRYLRQRFRRPDSGQQPYAEPGVRVAPSTASA
jgi:hypothetical protein